MKQESDPITDDEWLIRRVPREKFLPDKTPIVRPSAFQPRGIGARDPDTDGISFYRKCCLRSIEEVLATVSPEKRDGTAIVQVQVAQIKLLKLNGETLTVESKPDDRVKGHVVIPQLNTEIAQQNGGSLTPVLKNLAAYSSEPGNILRFPVPIDDSP